MTAVVSGTGSVTRTDVERARDRLVEHLLEHQHPDGWWKGNLETNVTMDAEDLMLRQFLGIRADEETEQAARWIRSHQHDDGAWATFHGGPGDLSTTIEAYVALRLAGDDVDAPHMRRARTFVLDNGGIEKSRVFTRIWLALFGEWPWDEVPAIPPEIILLPPHVPLNVYDFACWARQTIVPLAVVSALKPKRSLGFHVTELRT
ncbi:MAG: squalene--hopene cyclase, partial [Acidothermales bacterium]|nr:squalene--hopene cyclase [Acidothermales bacterium]